MDIREYERVRKDFIAETFDVMELQGEWIEAEANAVEGDLLMEVQASMAAPMRAAKYAEPGVEAELDELLASAKRLPSLGAWIREKAHRLDRVRYTPAIHEQGQVSRDYWSKLLNDEVKASKEKLLRVAVLLELSLEDAEEMLELAGYSLSSNILRDVVVMYCLRKELHDFVVIEQLLADHEVQSLFNDRRGA